MDRKGNKQQAEMFNNVGNITSFESTLIYATKALFNFHGAANKSLDKDGFDVFK